MGGLFALAGAIFFGISNIYVRQGLIDARCDKLTGLYVTLLINNILNAAVIILMALFFRGYLQYNFAGFWYYAAGGVLTSYLGRIFLFYSIELVGPSRAVSFKITAPVFTVFFGVVLLNEQIPLLAMIGIVLILVGVYYISTEMNRNRSREKDYYDNLCLVEVVNGAEDRVDDAAKMKSKLLKVGVVVGILAGLSFGSGNIFRKLGAESLPNPILGAAIGSFFALLALSVQMLISSWKKGESPRMPFKVSEMPQLFKSSYVGAGVTTSLAQYAIFSALLFTPVSLVNSIQAGEVLVTYLASYLIFKKQEMLSLPLVLSSLVLLIGVVILIWYS